MTNDERGKSKFQRRALARSLTSAEHLEQKNAQAPPIGTLAMAGSFEEFWTEIVRCAARRERSILNLLGET